MPSVVPPSVKVPTLDEPSRRQTYRVATRLRRGSSVSSSAAKALTSPTSHPPNRQDEAHRDERRDSGRAAHGASAEACLATAQDVCMKSPSVGGVRGSTHVTTSAADAWHSRDVNQSAAVPVSTSSASSSSPPTLLQYYLDGPSWVTEVQNTTAHKPNQTQDEEQPPQQQCVNGFATTTRTNSVDTEPPAHVQADDDEKSIGEVVRIRMRDSAALVEKLVQEMRNSCRLNDEDNEEREHNDNNDDDASDGYSKPASGEVAVGQACRDTNDEEEEAEEDSSNGLTLTTSMHSPPPHLMYHTPNTIDTTAATATAETTTNSSHPSSVRAPTDVHDVILTPAEVLWQTQHAHDSPARSSQHTHRTEDSARGSTLIVIHGSDHNHHYSNVRSQANHSSTSRSHEVVAVRSPCSERATMTGRPPIALSSAHAPMRALPVHRVSCTANMLPSASAARGTAQRRRCATATTTYRSLSPSPTHVENEHPYHCHPHGNNNNNNNNNDDEDDENTGYDDDKETVVRVYGSYHDEEEEEEKEKEKEAAADDDEPRTPIGAESDMLHSGFGLRRGVRCVRRDGVECMALKENAPTGTNDLCTRASITHVSNANNNHRSNYYSGNNNNSNDSYNDKRANVAVLVNRNGDEDDSNSNEEDPRCMPVMCALESSNSTQPVRIRTPGHAGGLSSLTCTARTSTTPSPSPSPRSHSLSIAASARRVRGVCPVLCASSSSSSARVPAAPSLGGIAPKTVALTPKPTLAPSHTDTHTNTSTHLNVSTHTNPHINVSISPMNRLEQSMTRAGSMPVGAEMSRREHAQPPHEPPTPSRHSVQPADTAHDDAHAQDSLSDEPSPRTEPIAPYEHLGGDGHRLRSQSRRTCSSVYARAPVSTSQSVSTPRRPTPTWGAAPVCAHRHAWNHFTLTRSSAASASARGAVMVSARGNRCRAEVVAKSARNAMSHEHISSDSNTNNDYTNSVDFTCNDTSVADKDSNNHKQMDRTSKENQGASCNDSSRIHRTSEEPCKLRRSDDAETRLGRYDRFGAMKSRYTGSTDGMCTASEDSSAVSRLRLMGARTTQQTSTHGNSTIVTTQSRRAMGTHNELGPRSTSTHSLGRLRGLNSSMHNRGAVVEDRKRSRGDVLVTRPHTARTALRSAPTRLRSRTNDDSATAGMRRDGLTTASSTTATGAKSSANDATSRTAAERARRGSVLAWRPSHVEELERALREAEMRARAGEAQCAALQRKLDQWEEVRRGGEEQWSSRCTALMGQVTQLTQRVRELEGLSAGENGAKTHLTSATATREEESELPYESRTGHAVSCEEDVESCLVLCGVAHALGGNETTIKHKPNYDEQEKDGEECVKHTAPSMCRLNGVSSPGRLATAPTTVVREHDGVKRSSGRRVLCIPPSPPMALHLAN